MKVRRKIMALILSAAVIPIFYNIYDNNRVIVQEQIVYIDKLPKEFDGFRILQMSDLHGKMFGKDQSYLISKVNSLNFDMIAFTGDMERNSDNDLTAFVMLLNGIENNKYMFYVNGNHDLAYSSLAGIESASGKLLEDKGCILLSEPYPIKRGGSTIWISNYFLMTDIDHDLGARSVFLGSEKEYEVYSDYLKRLKKMFNEINGNGDIKIMLNHIPFTANSLENAGKQNILDFSLIIAGHYHGGQIRIPFYGAIYIPGSTDEPGTWFPDQKDVSGLNALSGVQQYISRGLGSSIIPFRLFDTPEINIIVLKTK